MATNMHEAATNGDVVEVRRMVAAGADVEEQWGKFGERPLHVAARYGHVDVIVALVELGADKDAKSVDGVTPLHYAANQGHVEAITVLVQMGVDKDAKDVYGATPLHAAANNGHAEAVTALAQLGADIAARMNAETPLQLSIKMGHHQVAQVLREFESTARAQQAAAKELAQQAARQDIAEKRETADRVAGEILAEEEREEAAQTKVRLAPPSPHIGLHSAPLGGERCGVSVARVSASPLTA
jgi:ankyrin repeat protein